MKGQGGGGKRTPIHPFPSTINPLLVYPYDTRLHPAPVPDTDLCDCPHVVICLNAEWASHLDGVLERLLYTDAWDGSTEDKERAVQQIEKLLSQIKVKNMCCCGDSSTPKTPTNQRFNPATNRLEVSYDNGATWQTEPNDARFNTPLLPPTPGAPGDVKQCQAASNVVDALKRSVDFMLDTMGTVNNSFEVLVLVVGFVASLIGVIFSGGLAIPAALAAAAALLQSIYHLITSYGIAEFTADFTEDEWEIALCVIYCHTQPDGSYTEGDWNAIMNGLQTELAYKSNVADSLAKFVNSYGPVGMNNIARSRSVTAGDCDSCADCGCADGCDTVETFYPYDDAAWTTHGAYTRFAAATPVGETDSFTLAGTDAILDLGEVKCLTYVVLRANHGVAAGGGRPFARLYIDGVAQGDMEMIDNAGGDPPSCFWDLSAGVTGRYLKISQTIPPTAPGYGALLITLRVLTCGE